MSRVESASTCGLFWAGLGRAGQAHARSLLLKASVWDD